MKKYKDKRIQFVGLRDIRPPYVFLDNSGDVKFFQTFSQDRKNIGNIIKEGFSAVREKIIMADNLGPEFDEDAFVSSENDVPLWVRLYIGNYFNEEIEEINPKYYDLVNHLSKLYKNRRRKQERLICCTN